MCSTNEVSSGGGDGGGAVTEETVTVVATVAEARGAGREVADTVVWAKAEG